MQSSGKELIPQIPDLMFPTLEAVRTLGGSGHVSEIDNAIAEALDLPDEALEFRDHKADKLLYNWRCAWARTNLKAIGAMENTQRGVWAVTLKGRSMTSDQVREEFGEYQRSVRQQKKAKAATEVSGATPAEDEGSESWEDVLLQTMREMPSDAFERLAQRLLRESNFSTVEVTGRSGDGGIDGTGVLSIELISFQVLFQCKRYKESVGAREIRDFRGAMVGRTDKGLFITTGRFTPEARREATRDGAPPIDLIDGSKMCELLKRLNLGVRTETVEQVTINKEFFESI